MSEKTNKELITQCRTRLSEPMLYSSGRMASDVKELADRLEKAEARTVAFSGQIMTTAARDELFRSKVREMREAQSGPEWNAMRVKKLEAEVDEMLE